jgi:hypothetical protein
MRTRRFIVSRGEQASPGRADAEHVEEVAGDDDAADQLG